MINTVVLIYNYICYLICKIIVLHFHYDKLKITISHIKNVSSSVRITRII